MPVNIKVGNSFSQVTGLDTAQFNKLRKLLSYTPGGKNNYFSGNFNKIRYLIDNKGNFPTGLCSPVTSFLIDNKIESSYIQVRQSPPVTRIIDISYKGPTPRESQLDAASASTYRNRGTIAMPTGSGKSLVIALLIANLKMRTLIVVPNLEIKRQLTAALKTFLSDTDGIRVENIDSKALQTAKDYDCLIIDEAHHVAAKTYQKLNKGAWQGIYYRYFLTATPYRNDPEEALLFEGIAGQIIYQLSYQDAVDQGCIVPVEAYYLESPKQDYNGVTWGQVYSELVVRNAARNDLIKQMLLNFSLAGTSTLCLVKEIAHGELLAEELSIPFANGQNEDTRHYIQAFNSGKIKVLIGTTGIVGEGVDTKACEIVIIAGLGKAKSSFMQQVGRAVRTYPGKESAKVIIISDKSHKWTRSHFAEQIKILKDEYNIIAIKLEIS